MAELFQSKGQSLNYVPSYLVEREGRGMFCTVAD